jgi:CheY-like chemotaxis protein
VDDPAQAQKELLLVDDNPADTRLLAECLRAAASSYHLTILTDSAAALAFLQRHPPYTTARTPDLILLDIHPIKQSGWEILEWLRATPVLAHISVVMWGTLLSPFDEQECARLQPTQCLAKPMTLEGYERLAALIAQLLAQS